MFFSKKFENKPLLNLDIVIIARAESIPKVNWTFCISFLGSNNDRIDSRFDYRSHLIFHLILLLPIQRKIPNETRVHPLDCDFSFRERVNAIFEPSFVAILTTMSCATRRS